MAELSDESSRCAVQTGLHKDDGESYSSFNLLYGLWFYSRRFNILNIVFDGY